MEGNLLSRGLRHYVLDPPVQYEPETPVIPHLAGLTVLGMSYAASAALIAIDGPLPFGDALAVGILAVPDVFWYGLGYALFD